MIYYSDQDQLTKDFHWLAKDCLLDQFAYSRLPDHEFQKLIRQIENRIDDSFVEDLFNQFLSKLNLQSSIWEDELTRSMLPVIALIPGVGAQIVIDIDVNGVYKSLDINGTCESETFPEHTIFRMLKFQSRKPSLNSAKAMFKSIALKQKKYLNYAVIASLSINTLALGVAFYTMQVYDRVVSTNGISTLIALTIGVGIALILEIILKFSRSAIIDQASKNMDIEFSHHIFDRFLRVRSDSMPRGIGSLSSKIGSYAGVRTFITSASVFLFIDFPFAFMFLGVITLIGGLKIGLLILVFISISISVGFLSKNKIEVLTKTSTLASHKKLGLLVESVENILKIKTAGNSWSVMNKWNQFSDDAIDDEMHIHHYTDRSTFLGQFIQQTSYVTTVALGAYLIGASGSITMGSLIAITILANKVFQPMSQIPALFVQFAKTKVAIEDLDFIYKLPNDNENVDRPITAKLQSHNIELSDLKFSYNDNQVVLSLPKLKIQAGEKVGIVGTIGSGKSTLLKVLSGVYKPQVGRVLIGSLDMQQISRDRLCSTIGYLDQDTKLFSGTLRDNLILGLVNIKDEEILEISKLTGLIELISIMPEGLDTKVPEGGQSVSGGQRQMIALTRIILGRSKVLLLDEPTANMDEGTEKRLMAALQKNVTQDQTLVVVTHKPSLLQLVDRVIVMTQTGIIDGKKEDVLKHLADTAATAKLKKS